jgi:hypothetical protein
MSQQTYPCPECAEKGIEKVYNLPTGLGVHRKMVHGIAGSSSGAAAYKRKQAKIRGKAKTPVKHLKPLPNGRVACFYCDQTFDGIRWRSRHINVTHPGKSVTGPKLDRPKPAPVSQVDREIAADKALVAFTIGQMKNECKHIARIENVPERQFIQMCAEYFMKVAQI